MEVLGSISVCILLVITIGSLVKWFKRPTAPNPFEEDARKPIQPLQTDSKIRKKTLKEGFTIDAVPRDLDGIVIGSGIAGLTAAATLAKAGKKILVLEQHYKAGGCCHTFKEKGYEFDVGIHYIGEMGEPSFTRTCLEQISDGQIRWTPLEEAYDKVVFGLDNPKTHEVKSGTGMWEKDLIKSFPAEEEGIKKFFQMMSSVTNAAVQLMVLKALPQWLTSLIIKSGVLGFINSSYDLAELTVKEVVEGLVTNTELRAILSYNFGDYGTFPKYGPLLIQMLVHQHYRKGAFYPYGGASEIPYHIIPVIERMGGKVLMRADVQQIIVNNEGRACGVSLTRGNSEYNVYAPVVISAAGVHNTLNRFLPRSIAEKSGLWNVSKKLKAGHGATSVFLGLEGSSKELNLKSENIWFHSTPLAAEEMENYLHLNVDEAMNAEIPVLFISFPSAKDPSWDTRFPGTSNCTLIAFSNFEWFQQWDNEKTKKRGADYDAVKNAIGQQMIDQACRLFPQIKDRIKYINVGSPVTNNFYIGSKQGEIYGLDHNTERFSRKNYISLRTNTDVPGLYLAGQDIVSAGLAPSMYSGIFAASAVLGRQVFSDLSKLHRRLHKKKKHQ